MTIRAVCSGDMPGNERWTNVLHFMGNLADVNEANQLATNIGDFYGALVDTLATDWTLDTIQLGGVTVGTEYEYDSGVSGSSSGVPIPNDCSVVVTWRTAIPSRLATGRSFLGGWTVNVLTRLDGTGATVLNEGQATAIGVAALGTLIGPALGPSLAVYSRPAPDKGRPASTTTEVTGGSVARRLATQRRRDMDTPRVPVGF